MKYILSLHFSSPDFQKLYVHRCLVKGNLILSVLTHDPPVRYISTLLGLPPSLLRQPLPALCVPAAATSRWSSYPSSCFQQFCSQSHGPHSAFIGSPSFGWP
eukprot:TRINITY_DN12695_c0_g1_i1.p1 TRINITY_DN12695_c0_g1~~TRINITY_DN12695_c0_g1_i1.p1  ORF type:complete len:102 (-),score=10.45 TRINITY_DN12695_c0_g1_i1:47-352(-)